MCKWEKHNFDSFCWDLDKDTSRMEGFRHLISPEGRTYVVSLFILTGIFYQSGWEKNQDKSLTIAIIMITRLGVLLQSYQAQWPLTRSSSARCPPTPPMPIISIMAIQGVRGTVHIYFVSQYYWGVPSYIHSYSSYTIHMGPNNHSQQCILVAGWRGLRISEGWT